MSAIATPPRVLAFAGSTREKSYNKSLARIAAQAAREAGAQVTTIDLRDFPLPLFDEDHEANVGLPDAGRRLKQYFLDHDGLLIAAPEYNSSITAVLKNAIDWISRATPTEPGLVAFRDKTAALLSASTGALGGLRGLVHLRSILGNIGVHVLPDQHAIPRAADAFAEDGTLRDPKQTQAVARIATRLVHVTARLHA